MVAAANLVEVAALVGDTARATMLNALMGGQSLTATELAYCANVSRATASGFAARLLTVTRQRRFSYYRIASPLVATMLESIKVVAAIEVPPRRQPRSANEDALCFARSCYDHLAGWVGVAVTDALVAMGHIVLTDEGGEVTSSGERFLSAFGADLRPRTRRIFCQPCLDWSERRYHIKGSRSRSITRVSQPVDYATHDGLQLRLSKASSRANAAGHRLAGLWPTSRWSDGEKGRCFLALRMSASGPSETSRDVRVMSVIRSKAEVTRTSNFV